MQYFITLSESKHDTSLGSLRVDLFFARYNLRYPDERQQGAIMQEAERLALIHDLKVIRVSVELETDEE